MSSYANRRCDRRCRGPDHSQNPLQGDHLAGGDSRRHGNGHERGPRHCRDQAGGRRRRRLPGLGGALRLSPADDIFIGVERQLDIDPEGQLIASVLSKKIAAGAQRLVLDIPVGPTAKFRSPAAGHKLAMRAENIASHFGLETVCVISDGKQPVGRAIGPALEMRDVLSVLRLEPDAPKDLRERPWTFQRQSLSLARPRHPSGDLNGRASCLKTVRLTANSKRSAWRREPFASRREPCLNKSSQRGSGPSYRDRQSQDRAHRQIRGRAGTRIGPLAHMPAWGPGRPRPAAHYLHADSVSELSYALDYARSVDHGIKVEGSWRWSSACPATRSGQRPCSDHRFRAANSDAAIS